MFASSHTRYAEDRTASIATDRRRRRMSGCAATLLAAALLLALPTIAAAEQALVFSKPLVVVDENGLIKDTYEVRLSTKPTNDVGVYVESSDIDVATVNKAVLTFTPTGWNSPETITVTGGDDRVDNAGGSRLVHIEHTPVGGGYGEKQAAKMEVWVTTSDDGVGLTVSPEGSPGSPILIPSENGGTKIYKVSLNSEPTSNVTVSVTSNDSTVATVSPSSLTFSSTTWDVQQRVIVTGEPDDDDNPRGYRDVEITNTPSGGGYDGVGSKLVLVRVSDAEPGDSDVAALTFTPVTAVNDVLMITDEDGGTATYTVKLDTSPRQSNVVVRVRSEDPEIATVAPAALTFTRENWDDPQTVTVTGVPDDVDNEDNQRPVTIHNEASGGGYGEVDATMVYVAVKDDDEQALEISRSPLLIEVDEDEGTNTYRVRMATEPLAAAAVTVTVTVTGTVKHAQVHKKGGAKGDETTLTFDQFDYNEWQTVTVTGVDDKVDNLNDQRHTSISHSYGSETPILLQVIVNDDTDDAGIAIIPTSLEISDDGTVKTYEVVLESMPRSDVTVKVESGDDTVTLAPPEDLTFTPDNWNDPQGITVTASDTVVNHDGSRKVTIKHKPSGGGYDEVKPADVKVTVTDSEETTELMFGGGAVSVTDKEKSTDTYTVKLKTKPTADVTVTPALDDDFDAVMIDTDTLVFTSENYSTPQKVTVTGTPDDEDNGAERSSIITHTIVAPGVKIDDDDDDDIDYNIRGASIPVTVKDDDTTGLKFSKVPSVVEGGTETYTVNLESDPVDSLDVTVVSSDPNIALVHTGTGSAAATATLTFANWETAETITVTGVDDKVDNPGTRRTVTITHTPAADYAAAEEVSVAVTDGKKAAELIISGKESRNPDEGATFTYSVSLETKPTGYVTVDVKSSDPSIATVRPALLTFTPVNYEDGQPVTVKAVRGGTATITHKLTGYSARDKSVKVEVKEVLSDGLRVSEPQVMVTEGSTVKYTVRLKTEPSGAVTVSATTNDADIATVSPSSLEFTKDTWEEPQTVTVTGVEDKVISDDRKATITHRVSGGSYDGEPVSVTVTVKDNDATAAPSSSSVEVTEASGAAHTATYRVELGGKPTGNVTVAVTKSGDSEAATVSPSTLTFTPSNWSARTLTVTAQDNQVDDGTSRSVTITHTFSGGGFDGVTNTVTVTVTDNDGIVVSSPTPAEIPEAGGTATYTVKLESQPAGSVTVAVKSSDEKAATVSPSTLTFISSNGTTAQTVTVTGVPDDVDNAGDKRPVTITHTPSGYGTSAETKTVTVTVKDDDDAPEDITLSVAPSRVEENDGATRITVTATVNGTTRYADAKSITVAVGASGDSAREGTDYQPVGAVPVRIAAGAASGTGTFTLTPVDDTEFESPETITVAGTLSGVTVTSASITLTDDDTPPTLSIDSPAVQEGDADTTTPLRFTVTLSKATAQAVTVKYAGAADGTAEAGADYEALTAGTLTFAEGDTKKTITVTVKGDDMDEDDETLKVMLSSPTIATIDVGTGTGTIRDDDEPPELSIKGATVAEGHAGTTTPLVFTVTKDGATSKEVTVDYKVSGGTAKRGEDYTAPATGTLTFNPDQATRQITITVKGDNVQEDDETIEIALQQAPKNATLAAGKSKATGTITDDDVLQTVAKDWMARFGRTAAAATVDAIAIRMNDAAGAGGEDHSLTLAGQRMALAGAAPLPLPAAARIEPWEEGATSRITLQDLAEDSAFDLGRSLAEGYLSVWAASSYHQFEKTSGYTLDGNLVSAILGADHAGDHHVAGMALAYHGGGGEYGDLGEDDEGELAAALYSFHPYVRLTIGDYLHIGGSFGAGTGSMNIKPAGGKEVETSMTMTALGALDARLDLNLSPGWLLAVQADAHTVHMVSAEKKPELPELATATNRIRLGLESSYAFLVGEGMSLAPTVEAGVRHDGGDAETGLGLDAGGGLRFTAAAIGLMVDARGHVVLSNFASDAQTGDAAGALREWGLGGMIRWRPDFGGHGPEVTLAPSYGAAAGGLNPGAIPSLDAEVGYRLPAFGGVLTPYSSAEFAGSGQRSYRAGAHLEFGHAVEVSAEGTYQQSATGDAEQFLTLRARLRQ